MKLYRFMVHRPRVYDEHYGAYILAESVDQAWLLLRLERARQVAAAQAEMNELGFGETADPKNDGWRLFNERADVEVTEATLEQAGFVCGLFRHG